MDEQNEEILADAEDLIDLREAKAEEGSAPTISLDEVKKRFGLEEFSNGLEPSKG
jgi:hypothetical protein